MGNKKPPLTITFYYEIPANWGAIEYRLKRKLTDKEKSDIVESYNRLQNGAWDIDVIKWDEQG